MKNKTVLFIEDEAVMQKAVSEFLCAQGYAVLSALDGEAGVRAAKEKLPDLILLDIILPKKNGIDVLKELKQDAATMSIPVIVLTNLVSHPTIECNPLNESCHTA